MMGLGAMTKLPRASILAEAVRGIFLEIHRDEWLEGERPVQWNAVRSRANVLRGVHIHRVHADQVVVVDGTMLLGLHDARRDSPTRGLSTIVELRGDAPPRRGYSAGGRPRVLLP